MINRIVVRVARNLAFICVLMLSAFSAYGQDLFHYPGTGDANGADVMKQATSSAVHRAFVDFDRLAALAPGATLPMTLPNGVSHEIVAERIELGASGARVWLGRLAVAGGNGFKVVITQAKDAVIGTIHTPEGSFDLEPLALPGEVGIIDYERAGLMRDVSFAQDAISPPRSNDPFIRAVMKQLALDELSQLRERAKATPTPQTTIDMMVVTTPAFATRHGANAAARIDTLIAIANQAMIDSEVAVTLRLAGHKPTSYSDTTTNSDALTDITGGTRPAALANVGIWRNELGADLVVLLRPYRRIEHAGCGLAWIGGAGVHPISQDEAYAFSVVSEGTDLAGSGFFCEDASFTHEVGHNLGLMHDRGTVQSDNVAGGCIVANDTLDRCYSYGATYYAFGYNVSSASGVKGTIMSYQRPRLLRWSNATLNNCDGVACGVAHPRPDTCNPATDPTQCRDPNHASADEARTLNLTRFAIAAYRASVLGNTPPVATNDAFSVANASTGNIFDVLANDTDANGDPLAISSVSAPSSGTASISAGKIVYNAAAGFAGTATFTYTISDGKGGTATATVTVTVNAAANTPPVAANDAFTVANGSTGNIFNVLANDTDANGDPLTITTVSTPSSGTASISAGKIVYNAAAGFAGTATFTYTISDGKGGTANATVTVTVSAAANTPPVATNDAFTVANGSTGNVLDVLANDTDANGDPLTITTVSAPSSGTASISAGKIVYNAAAGFAGTATFTYTISDGKGGTASATVTVTVSAAANTPPVATNDSFNVANGSTGNVLDVLANDTDANGDPLTISSVSTPSSGTASISAGKIVYNAAAGFAGTATFTYTISDGKGGTANATVTVTVAAVAGTGENVALASKGAIATASSTYAPAFSPAGTNDGDRKGTKWGNNGGWNPALTGAGQWLQIEFPTAKAINRIEVITVQDNYTTPIEPTPTLTFQYYGLRDFNVQAWDGTAWVTVPNGVITANNNVWRTINFPVLTTTKIRILVTGTTRDFARVIELEAWSPSTVANVPPVANNDAYTVANASTGNVFDVLANDTDANSDPLSITSVSTPSSGTASISAGKIVYNAAAGFAGTATFTYTISDGNGGTANATVTVTVSAAANTPPVATNDAFTVANGSTGNVLDVLGNDTDANGDTLTISSVSTPSSGTASISAGKIVYNAAAGFAGTATFTYTISDGKGGTATATVTVTISAAANTPPVAVNDSFTVANGSTDNIFNVLANDTDANGDPLTITAVSTPSSGAASISAGKIVYNTAAGFAGTATFTYTISDGKGGTATATVTVTVSAAANTPPVATNDSFTVANASTGNILDVLTNDTDANGDPLTITSVSTPSSGTASISAGKIVYNAAAGFTGAATFTYTISDGKGGTATATVTVTVSPATSTGENVALATKGAIASASSVYAPAFGAGGTNDGDRKGTKWGSNGGWNPALTGAGQWLQIEFPTAKSINRIEVITVQDNYTAPIEPTPTLTFQYYGLRDFNVQAWDGTAWVTVPNGVITGNNNVWRTITFPTLSTTKIRILSTSTVRDFARLIEVEAWTQ